MKTKRERLLLFSLPVCHSVPLLYLVYRSLFPLRNNYLVHTWIFHSFAARFEGDLRK